MCKRALNATLIRDDVLGTLTVARHLRGLFRWVSRRRLYRTNCMIVMIVIGLVRLLRLLN